MSSSAVRRSGLTMPVNNPRFIEKAWTRGCDFIILDLEDSVPPSQKAYARTLVKAAIATVSKGGAEVFVRINHDTVREDLEGSVWPGLKRVNYPKAETAQEIMCVDDIITELERKRGIQQGFVEIGANIETALGVANAVEIAEASPRIKDFGGGGGYDMSRDLGVEMFVEFDQFVYGAGELEMAARVQGLEIHSSPFMPNLSGSVSDGDHALKVAEATRKLGFHMGGGLHPNVVAPQNQGFTPSPAEVEQAQRVLEHYKSLELSDKVSVEIDGLIVDKYEAKCAQHLLSWARLCALRDQEKLDMVEKTKGLSDD